MTTGGHQSCNSRQMAIESLLFVRRSITKLFTSNRFYCQTMYIYNFADLLVELRTRRRPVQTWLQFAVLLAKSELCLFPSKRHCEVTYEFFRTSCC